jgi:hypothetical protein
MGNIMDDLVGLPARSSNALVRTASLLIAASLLSLSGCSSQTGYSKAFSEKTALSDNSHKFVATSDQTFRTVKLTLVQQGFTIEQADIANGLIKAARTFEDPKQRKFSYLVITSVDVTETPNGKEAVVTLSASQQTILHKDSEKYFHLLGLVPIPTGKEYQTIVTKEGNVIDKSFYNDFFAAIGRNIALMPAATARTPAAVPAAVLVVAPAAEPVAAPAALSIVAPAAEPVTAPAAVSIVAPAAEPVAAPAAMSIVGPVAQPAAAPAAMPIVAPAALPIAAPVVEPAAAPVAVSIVAPLALPAALSPAVAVSSAVGPAVDPLAAVALPVPAEPVKPR